VAVNPGSDLEDKRRREFRRMVAVSLVVHAGALGVAVSSPAPRAVAPPQVIAVELVSDPGRPAPRARPSPPKPRAPKPEKTLLPAKPRAPKPEKTLLPAKPRGPSPPKPERRKEVFLDPAPKQEKSLEDLLADFREEEGEPSPAPAPTPAQQPTQTAALAPSGALGGQRVAPEVADWMRRAKLHVKRAWVVPPGFRTQPLTTRVVLTLDAAGNVVGEPEIVSRSGNPWYDEGVVRGIAKASPLPPPPEAGDWDFVFVPEDSY
jgi:hypothetical protein